MTNDLVEGTVPSPLHYTHSLCIKSHDHSPARDDWWLVLGEKQGYPTSPQRSRVTGSNYLDPTAPVVETV